VWHDTPASSNVAAVGWRPEVLEPEADSDPPRVYGTVYVRFRSGAVYAYRAVPMPVWDQLLEWRDGAQSVGRYVATRLRAQYVTERLP
jgi:hypothetical protein